MLTEHGTGLQFCSDSTFSDDSKIQCNVKLKRSVHRLQGTRNCTVIIARALSCVPFERSPAVQSSEAVPNHAWDETRAEFHNLVSEKYQSLKSNITNYPVQTYSFLENAGYLY
jgi:hypothetical protein